MKFIFSIFLLALPFVLTAQTYNKSSQGSNNSAGGAYVAPVVTKTYNMGSNSSTATPYTSKNAGGTINITSFDKKDAETIQALAKGSDITEDAYYAKMIDQSNAQFARNGVLAPSKDGWKAIIKRLKESEWPAKFPPKHSFDSGYATVIHQGNHGVIDTAGNIIIPIIWGGYASTFGSGLACVKTGGPDSKCGFMNKSNTLVIPLKYDDFYIGFREGLAAVKKGKKWGYINTEDATIIPFMYDEAACFSGGYAIVESKKKSGVIDKTGKQIIPLKYESISVSVSDKMVIFRNKNKWGALDLEGNQVIAPIYDKYFSFFKGKAEVTLKSRTFYIDKTGTEVAAR